MKTLFTNVHVVNVFVDEIQDCDVLVENDLIIGYGNYYTEKDADDVVDCHGMYMCPGFIDGHIHIESSKLSPAEFCRAVLPHGTVSVIADPHEIANVSGLDGIEYMLEASENIPLKIYYMMPSCVPASPFEESLGVLGPNDIEQMLQYDRVIGLGEMMNYPGVINEDPDVIARLETAWAEFLTINGHAPLLTGKDLDKYISYGIYDDHECSSFEEAKEKITKGQAILIRKGSSTNNLPDLIKLFDEPYNRFCSLCSDDKNVADILENGHIDAAIREAISLGVDPCVAIRMATLQQVYLYGYLGIGGIAPGYKAHFLLLDDLDKVSVKETYIDGKLVAKNGVTEFFDDPVVDPRVEAAVYNTMNLDPVSEKDFKFNIKGKHKCHVIGRIENQIITDDLKLDVNFDKNNGIDIDKDIVKVAVLERHNRTGNIGLGLVSGLGLKNGAIASTVGHDGHNVIVVGDNEDDMACAVNRLIEIDGGNVVVSGGNVTAEMSMPIAGLMSDKVAAVVSRAQNKIKSASASLCKGVENPFEFMAFLSLSVIPHLKITSKGLVDVDKFDITDIVIK